MNRYKLHETRVKRPVPLRSLSEGDDVIIAPAAIQSGTGLDHEGDYGVITETRSGIATVRWKKNGITDSWSLYNLMELPHE